MATQRDRRNPVEDYWLFTRQNLDLQRYYENIKQHQDKQNNKSKQQSILEWQTPTSNQRRTVWCSRSDSLGTFEQVWLGLLS